MVGANVGIIAVEVFSHLEDASGLAVFRPEILGDLWDGIDADAIEAVLLDEVMDPVLEVTPHVGVALVQVGEASESAVLNLPLVVPVVDVAVVVVVLSLVERVDITIVVLDRSNVVGDNVDHDPDALAVCVVDHSLELLLISEVGVYFLPVCGPVTMVTSSEVVNNGRDPDGVEAEVLDVLDLVDDASMVTTAVVVQVAP